MAEEQNATSVPCLSDMTPCNPTLSFASLRTHSLESLLFPVRKHTAFSFTIIYNCNISAKILYHIAFTTKWKHNIRQVRDVFYILIPCKEQVYRIIFRMPFSPSHMQKGLIEEKCRVRVLSHRPKARLGICLKELAVVRLIVALLKQPANVHCYSNERQRGKEMGEN